MIYSAKWLDRRGGDHATQPLGRSDAGVALVIALGFIVLLTIVVVAYLARTQLAMTSSTNSGAMVQTEILAETSVETIVGDLRDEMLAGSATEPLQPDGTLKSMQVSPDGRWAAVPARTVAAGVDATNVNLIKQSLYKVPSYPDYPATSHTTTPSGNPLYTAKKVGGATTGKARASKVVTTTAALDGRTVSANRWSESGLLVKNLTDDTGVPSDPTKSQLPDWIYINRRGLQDDGSVMDTASGLSAVADPSSGNESFVIGRVAYNIYDTGGLLNANTMGYPVNPQVQAYSIRKGSPAWADAHYIGMANGGSGMGDTEISDLVKWRNSASVPAFPAFQDYVHNWGEMVGFLLPFTTGTKTDGVFVSRQDLIHYWLRKNAVSDYASLSQTERQKLSELTSFSAFATEPSFYTADQASTVPQRPTILASASGGNYWGDTPGSRPIVNPHPPDIQVQAGGGFVRYRKTAGTATAEGAFTRQVPAVAGETLVNSRFPLSRLALITQTATGAADDSSDIHKFFGLSRAAVDQPWIYAHPRAGTILTLAKVAGQNREPDFFELLQAAIDAGSVAKTFPRAGDTSRSGYLAVNTRDQQPAYNIIQIGANIISQTDPTGYPTAIQFADATHIWYGVKSLPYFTRYRAPLIQVSASATSYVYRVFLQPEVWNPHEVTAADGTSLLPATGPTKFRIVAKTAAGGVMGYCTPAGGSPTTFGGGAMDETTDALTFNTQNNNYSEPTPLCLTGAGDVLKTGAADGAVNGTASTLVGMPSGPLTRSSQLPTGSTWYLDSSDQLSMLMQYLSASGNWVTYSSHEFLSAEAASGADSNIANPYIADIWTIAQHQLAGRWTGWDPRTDRFNFPGAMNYRDNDPTGYPFYNYNAGSGLVVPASSGPYGYGTLRPSTANGYGPWTINRAVSSTYGWTVANGAPFMPEGSIAMGTITQNNSQLANTTWYNDPDGVDRGGDGFYWTRGIPGLLLANNNTQSRPYMLNRLFQSVGELGYVFRGVPYRSLDFFTQNSGDSALLDTFCIDEQPDNGIVAGHVSLNTRQPDVLNAILMNSLGTEPTVGTGDVTSTTAPTISQAMQTLMTGTGPDASLVSVTGGTGPMINRSEIATRLMPLLENPASQFYNNNGAANTIIKRRAEAVVRALADSVETNTWNVMVDMVVQSGRFPTNGTKSASAFQVSGERRYWAHLAIDRSTGKVIASYIEPDHE